MKKILVIFFSTFAACKLDAQNVNFAWARQISGIGAEYFSHAIATDVAGNVYTTGSFNGTVDFDPGPAVYNLTSTGPDIFICKLNATGSFVWARQMVGTGFQSTGYGITVDAQGNIFTTGSFYGTVDFDPGPAVYNMTGSPVAMFVSKLNAAGNLVWAKHIGGVSNDNAFGRSIALDIAGNILITGSFYGTSVDFDPGPGLYILNSSFNVEKIFVSKLDGSGNFVWAKQMVAILDGSGIAGASGKSIAVDMSGNVYTTGTYGGTVDFDPGTGNFYMSTISTSGNSYVSKLDAAGNFIWANQIEQNVSVAMVNSLALDVFGSIYTTGYFGGTADFDPGSGVFNMTSSASNNVYILKLDVTGNFIWAKQMAGSGSSGASSISIDAIGNVYTTGSFSRTVDFDPGPRTYDITTVGINGDMFVSKLDKNGDFIWAKQMGGGSSSYAGANAISLDAFGNIFTTGEFKEIVDFDPDTPVFNLTSVESLDIFVHKLSRCSNSTSSTINASACSTYTLNGQTYTLSGVYTQTLINAAGCDSIVILNLAINNRYTIINAAVCNSYLWNGQTYTNSGTYQDTLAASNGCDSIFTLNLVINSRSFSNINIAICPGQNYEGHTTTGTYIDTIVAANGCDSVRTLNLTVKTNCNTYIPNTFTPNNDGLNDLFKPTINRSFQHYSFVIFNRYGQKIFETGNYGTGWNGTYKGKDQPSGSYVYRIKFTDISGQLSENNGTVLLLR